MSFGKPIIVSDCPSQENVVIEEKCGLVFKEKDSKMFSEKVLQLFHDAKLYSEAGQNAIRAIKGKYYWENTSADLVEMYKEFSDN